MSLPDWVNVTANNTVHIGTSRVTLPVVDVKDLPYWNPPKMSSFMQTADELFAQHGLQ